MNALELINLGAEKLKNNKIPNYFLDTELLLSKTLKQRRETILTDLNQRICAKNILEFKKLIERRSLNEPIAYILKEKEFWSKKFEVNRHTLIPRPETELLVEKLVNIFKKKRAFILDIGTGTGCILISLISEIFHSRGIGVDISKKALQMAEKNSCKFKVKNKIKFCHTSFAHIINKKFDLVVSNPPYIKSAQINGLEKDIKCYEPKVALDGGNDGLDVIKKVIYKSSEILKINGTLALEIGNNQYKQVSNILLKNKFRIIKKIKDYRENIRCLISIKIN